MKWRFSDVNWRHSMQTIHYFISRRNVKHLLNDPLLFNPTLSVHCFISMMGMMEFLTVILFIKPTKKKTERMKCSEWAGALKALAKICEPIWSILTFKFCYTQANVLLWSLLINLIGCILGQFSLNPNSSCLFGMAFNPSLPNIWKWNVISWKL